jgi:hypothetical protein
MTQLETMDLIYNKLMKAKLIEESKLTSQILFSFIFIALFSKLIFSGFTSTDEHGSHGHASISIMSYCIMLFSLISIVTLNVLLHANESSDGNPLAKVVSWDMIIIVVYLCWLISINLNHYKRINKDKVPPNYYLYSNLSVFVIVFQIIFFIIHYIANNDTTLKGEDIFNQYKDLFTRIDFIHYILMFLNFILILIQQIILDNFSVDIA